MSVEGGPLILSDIVKDPCLIFTGQAFPLAYVIIVYIIVDLSDIELFLVLW